MTERDDQVELEVAAFAGPHIKRARILLAVLGALYLYSGWTDLSPIGDLRDAIAQLGEQPGVDEARHAVTLAYVLVLSALVSGVADLVLAVVGSTRMTGAMYAAGAIFVLQSVAQIICSKGLLLLSVLWWVSAFILAFAVVAAHKARKLRASPDV